MTESILTEAHELIHGDRNKQYGHPRDNFGQTAALFSAYKGVEFTALDVAVMMILVKVSRIGQTGYQRDSFTDIAGYAGCAERIYEEPVDLDERPIGSWQNKVTKITVKTAPRVWESVFDIPVGTLVEQGGDEDLLFIPNEGKGWYINKVDTDKRSRVDGWCLSMNDNLKAPFTEVIG